MGDEKCDACHGTGIIADSGAALGLEWQAGDPCGTCSGSGISESKRIAEIQVVGTVSAPKK